MVNKSDIQQLECDMDSLRRGLRSLTLAVAVLPYTRIDTPLKSTASTFSLPFTMASMASFLFSSLPVECFCSLGLFRGPISPKPVYRPQCRMRGWLLLETPLSRFSAPLRWEFTPYFIPGPSHWKQAQPVRFITGCLAPPR